MKTRVIPAQITTVEDKIIGNFNLIQIVILLASVFGATIIFALVPPTMIIVAYKIVLMMVVLGISGILVVRIKDKLVVEWIGVLIRFNLRPKYYVFDKNEIAYRQLWMPEKIVPVKQAAKNELKLKGAEVSLSNLVRLDNLIEHNGLNVRFRTNSKGGLNVAFEKITR